MQRTTDERNDSALLRQGMGANGSDKFSDTTLHEGRWIAIYAHEDSVIEEFDGNMDLAGETLTEGTILPAAFVSIKLTSGKVFCFRA